MKNTHESSIFIHALAGLETLATPERLAFLESMAGMESLADLTELGSLAELANLPLYEQCMPEYGRRILKVRK